jgi:hypothetical protein
MSSKAFERTIEAIRSLDCARTPVEVRGTLLGSVRQFSAGYVLAGVIPMPGAFERIGKSEHGVDKRMHSAWEKFGIRTRVQVVAEGIRRSLIK